MQRKQVKLVLRKVVTSWTDKVDMRESVDV